MQAIADYSAVCKIQPNHHKVGYRHSYTSERLGLLASERDRLGLLASERDRLWLLASERDRLGLLASERDRLGLLASERNEMERDKVVRLILYCCRY